MRLVALLDAVRAKRQDGSNRALGERTGSMLDIAAPGGRKRWLLAAAAVALTITTAAATATAAPMSHGSAGGRSGFFEIPAFGSCIDGGRLTVRVRALPHVRWVRATVWINGRRVKNLKGKRITKPLTLTGLDTPLIVLRLSAGSYKGLLAGVLRPYRACWAIPPDGRYSEPGGSGISFSVTGGGTWIRDVSGDVSLSCTSVGGAVDRLAVADVPIRTDGSFASVTTRAGQFRGGDATFTYTVEGRRIQGAGFAGTYRVDIVYDGGASSCTSATHDWSAMLAAP
jgi:hypothetical protein